MHKQETTHRRELQNSKYNSKTEIFEIQPGGGATC